MIIVLFYILFIFLSDTKPIQLFEFLIGNFALQSIGFIWIQCPMHGHNAHTVCNKSHPLLYLAEVCLEIRRFGDTWDGEHLLSLLEEPKVRREIDQ